ncbi:hypothetical protein dsat_1894 [Alkalidesulfovibrio alkalitolerans DSM 16529]|uniref:Uncharacterized protein n=1 Tax=Alkalidesulfovibrio alkalitolerans DSM 16529 TaxID=1121439 RepID=S7UT96_9BACT|nr:hypothetical protein [Alkalidesulfovibrio alkalitolerans]EPR35553.1 hypothetical protein dsat_1894 [Alkalidesulfovibrio alkalitolerans DSM 16529]
MNIFLRRAQAYIAYRLQSFRTEISSKRISKLDADYDHAAIARELKRQIRVVQPSGTRKKANVLFLPKAGHTEDIMACFGQSSAYGLYALDRRLVKAVFEKLLPITIDDNNYKVEDEAINTRKDALRKLWKRILPSLVGETRIDAVFSGNFSYAAEQELAGACSELGIPFIAIHKECLKTDLLKKFYEDVYRTRKNAFQGAKSLVYNNAERDIQVGSGCVRPDQIEVVGMPRLDALHLARRVLEKKDRISRARPLALLFSFNSKSGLPSTGRKCIGFEKLSSDLEQLNMPNLVRNVHRRFVDLAREHGDVDFVIKAKGNADSDNVLRECLAGQQFPPNLTVVSSGDPMDLLVRCSVACGINSTALIEAIALKKPVVTFAFDEAADQRIKDYCLDLDGVAEVAASVDELGEMLLRHVRSAPETRLHQGFSERELEVLDYYVGNTDGLAGARVRESLDALLRG